MQDANKLDTFYAYFEKNTRILELVDVEGFKTAQIAIKEDAFISKVNNIIYACFDISTGFSIQISSSYKISLVRK